MKENEALFEGFSSLFDPVDIRQDMTQSCMAWGFECGEGWYPLIEELLAKLLSLNAPGLIIEQVKEKFGGLRVYYRADVPENLYDKIDSLISFYEKKSYTICEVCGKPGKLYSKGWWQTVCPEHVRNKETQDGLEQGKTDECAGSSANEADPATGTD